MADLSYDDLIRMGAKPASRTGTAVQEPPPRADAVTYEQLVQAGASPGHEDQGAMHAFLTHGAQAVLLNRGDELAGGAMDLFSSPSGVVPGANASPELVEQVKNTPTAGQKLRDRLRADETAAFKNHPGWSLAGSATGGIASAVAGNAALRGGGKLLTLVGATKAMPTVASGIEAVGNALSKGGALKRALGAAGPIGALYGTGASEADLGKGELDKYAMDAAVGYGTGAGGGLIADKVVVPVAKFVSAPLAKLLDRFGVSQVRRVLTNGADSMSNRNPVREDAVREAVDSGAVRAFGSSKETYDRLVTLAEQQGVKYGDIIDKLEKLGVQGPDAHLLAEELIDRSAQEFKNSGANKSVAKAFMEEAENILSLAQKNGRLGLSQAEKIKRTIASDAHYGVFEETAKNEAKKEIASIVRQANEDTIDRAGRMLPGAKEAAEEFVPTKQRLGRLLEGRDTAERGVARGAQRKAVSLGDKLMTSAGIASGNPGGMAVGLAAGAANNFLRNRGTSAIGVGSLQLSKALQSMGALAPAAAEVASSHVPQRTGSLLNGELLLSAFAEKPTAEKRGETLKEAIRRRKRR